MLGDKIGLSPVAVVFAVLAGAQLGGILGMLIALPVAAVIVVLLRHAREFYENSPMYSTSTYVVQDSSAGSITIETDQVDQWAVYAGAEGPYYMSKIDSETRWLESYDLIAGESDQMGDETDPASFSTLLEGGRDDYDFTTLRSSWMVP